MNVSEEKEFEITIAIAVAKNYYLHSKIFKDIEDALKYITPEYQWYFYMYLEFLKRKPVM